MSVALAKTYSDINDIKVKLRPIHRRADVLICREYETLAAISCILDAVAHFLLAVNEIMTAPKGTEIL